MRKQFLASLALATLASCSNSGTEKETVEKNNPKTEVKKEVKCIKRTFENLLTAIGINIEFFAFFFYKG